MTIQLKTMKPVNKMSKRERFESRKEEIAYGLKRLSDRLNWLHSNLEIKTDGRRHLFIGLTTPSNERNMLTVKFNSALYGLSWIKVMAGRIGKHDAIDAVNRPVFEVLDWSYWLKHEQEIQDLLTCFTVLIDSLEYATSPKGKWAARTRHLQPEYGDVTLALKYATERTSTP